MCDWNLIRKLDRTAEMLHIYHENTAQEIEFLCNKALELQQSLYDLRKETLATVELFFELLNEYCVDKDYVASETFQKILMFYKTQTKLHKKQKINN